MPRMRLLRARMTAAVAAMANQGNLRKSDRRKKSPSFLRGPILSLLCTLFVCEMRNAVAAFTATDLRLDRRKADA